MPPARFPVVDLDQGPGSRRRQNAAIWKRSTLAVTIRKLPLPAFGNRRSHPLAALFVLTLALGMIANAAVAGSLPGFQHDEMKSAVEAV